jgi:serine phosphatase RsbU (regulator of sigma subunit)/anti-sigma regulatory factor (Ser/Thr protein kinase)
MANLLQTLRKKRTEEARSALALLQGQTGDPAQTGSSGEVDTQNIPGQVASTLYVSQQVAAPTFEIIPNDPIIAYFLSVSGVVDIQKLHLDSPALRALKGAGVKLAIPLISQGDLVGILNLGPRLSEQDYSTYDRKLLSDLATQAAPAVRVAQLVREQQAAIQERERIQQELAVARLIQQTLLPKELPKLPGWHLAAYYQPARAVGGDFYDFLFFEDGRLGLVIGDVTDKGVPAAMVMAATRTMLRASAMRLIAPGAVLERVNDVLFEDIPPKMFVTCLYAVLDPATGRLVYANAGHDLPYRRSHGGVSELRATGMPLGLMPGMAYEEKETFLEPGETILFYSDGLAEAHNPEREMLGFPRVMGLLAEHAGKGELIDFLLAQLTAFTGPGWEQEDDVTLVTLQRASAPDAAVSVHALQAASNLENGAWRPLTRVNIPSEPGNERLAMEQVEQVVAGLGLSSRRLESLKTAVAEATMNAMEHGNQYQPEKPVIIEVLASEKLIAVRITDEGGAQPIPEAETPDLEAKLAELQTPRGWGLFLIKNLVDEMRVVSDATHHTIELLLALEREYDDS